MSYTKLFSSIVASTIWQESKETKILWVTMLAIKNQYGIVESSVPGLAKFAGLSMKETQASLKDLLAPDEYSRTKDHQGRRIEPVDGGWLVLKHDKYRAMENAEDRREQLRLAQARFRDKQTKKKRRAPVRVYEVDNDHRPGNHELAPPSEDHRGSYEQHVNGNGDYGL